MMPLVVVPAVVAVVLPNEVSSVLHQANNENKEIKYFVVQQVAMLFTHCIITFYNLLTSSRVIFK